MKTNDAHNSRSLFQLIDLDRTLFNTVRFVELITDEINQSEPGFGASLQREFETAYAEGRTFFMFRQLRQDKGDVWVEALVANVVGKHGADSFLMPGARRRIEQAALLTDETPAWGVLTYGDQIDQYMKLRIIGLENAPTYITRTPHKGGIIQDWAQPGGGFKLPEVFGGAIVDYLSLEDDKLIAFYDMPAGVLGLWLTQEAHAKELLAEEDLGYVRAVHSLHESLEVLSKRG
ncbi:MAG: hypothetical protein ACREGE_00965 [Candidatus Microsaccharimonas sp.]